MMLVVHVATHSHYYGPLQLTMGKDPPPLEIPLHVNKRETIPHIPKGFMKHSMHNPNAQAPQHYSII